MFKTDWKQILRLNFVHWKKLADFLELNEIQRQEILERSHFPLNLPYRLAQKIEKGTLNDPILKQFLPIKAEAIATQGFVVDPVGDQASRKGHKLLHKYKGRVLLVCTSACAMHCRYCFRQNFAYETKEKTFDNELEYIRNDSSIKEVILSGGDPLSLSETFLHPLLLQISCIPHVKRIRFHSRFPIGIPERIDSEFLSFLEKLPQQIWFILHTNHPQELDEDIFLKMKELQRRSVVIGNQAVLLKGVNDDPLILQELCEKLVDHGILPYYLHQLDRVQGAAHFEVSEQEGLHIMEILKSKLPGYAVPKFVREIAGQSSKSSIN